MKIVRQPKIEEKIGLGDERHREGFLFFPCKIKQKELTIIRWLEHAKWKEAVGISSDIYDFWMFVTFRSGNLNSEYCWRKTQWLDIDETTFQTIRDEI